MSANICFAMLTKDNSDQRSALAEGAYQPRERSQTTVLIKLRTGPAGLHQPLEDR